MKVNPANEYVTTCAVKSSSKFPQVFCENDECSFLDIITIIIVIITGIIFVRGGFLFGAP